MNLEKLIDHLKLDKQEFLFQFNSHPNYPSALAFSDTLNFLGVKNDAYELEKQYWNELPEEYIAIVDNQFSLVKKNGNQFSIYGQDVKSLSEKELHEKASDFILLFEKTQKSEEKSQLNFQFFLYVILGVVLLHSILSHQWYEVLYNVLSILGLYLSLEIFNQKFGQESVVINNLCGAGAGSSQNSKTDCSQIISSDSINVVGLKLSDLSLVYFSALLMLGWMLPAFGGFLKIVSLATIFVIGYSLYIQLFVEKALCRICLFLIAILVSQIVISTIYFGNFVFFKDIILYSVLIFGLAFSMISYLNSVLEKKHEYKNSGQKLLRFKRNYELFKKNVLEKDKINFQNTDVFFLGNPNAPLHISLITNPYCGYCKGAHEILEKLLKKYPDQISAQLRFNYFENIPNDTYKSLVSDFLEIYKTKGQNTLLNALGEWFSHKNEAEIRQKFNKDSKNIDISTVVEAAEENKSHGFTFTPLFLINGYQFPDMYDREDIFYFIDDLVEDEEIV